MKDSFKKIPLTLAVVFWLGSPIFACPQCRAQVRSNIYNDSFGINILVLSLPLLILAVVGAVLFFGDELQKKLR